MKKFLLLWAFVSLMVGQSFAQCVSTCTFNPDRFMNKVRICQSVDADNIPHYKISENAVIGKTVIFEFTGTFLSDPSILINFGDGKGSVSVTTPTKTITYFGPGPSSIFGVSYYIKKGDTDKSKAIFSFDLLIKNAIKPYIKPDAIWDISTNIFFDPKTVGALNDHFEPALIQQGVMNTTIGEGKAYIRFGKNHDNKIVRPIIYVDGIDFSTATEIIHDASISNGETDNANIIRFGSTGWDVFVTGAEDGYSESVPNAREDFRDYSGFQRTIQLIQDD